MTIIAYAHQALWADSYNVIDTGEGSRSTTDTTDPSNLKIYQSPCKRWAYTKSGSMLRDHPMFDRFVIGLTAALSDFYADQTAVLHWKEHLEEGDLKLWMTDSLVLTHSHMFNLGKTTLPCHLDDFLAYGTGYPYFAASMLFEDDPALAMRTTVELSGSCMGPIHCVKQADLLPFKVLHEPPEPAKPQPRKPRNKGVAK